MSVYPLMHHHQLSTWDTGKVGALQQKFFRDAAFYQPLCWNTSQTLSYNQSRDLFFSGIIGSFSVLLPYEDCLVKKKHMQNVLVRKIYYRRRIDQQ